MKLKIKSIKNNCITTMFITLTLTYININEDNDFLSTWLKSWLIASIISNIFSIFIFGKSSNKNIKIKSIIVKNSKNEST
jgi:hypothetical protein